MSLVRLAAIDLDGTLLDANGTVSSASKSALAKLQGAGITCIIASGRMHESTLRYLDELGLTGPVISYNGALVREHPSNTVLLHIPMPSGPANEIVEFCARHQYHLNYYLDDHLYVAHDGEWATFYREHTGSTMQIVGDLSEFGGSMPTKLILIDAPVVTARLEREFRERYGAELYITRTNSEYLEFMGPTVNKGTALAYVARRMGIAAKETAAFGDGDNDVPMLRWAHLGVAVAGASHLARNAARLTVPDGAGGFAAAVGALLRHVDQSIHGRGEARVG